jgi:hypothetical protein
MNPRNDKQKVIVGVVSGFGRIDTFHFNTIPESWLKVNVKEVMPWNCPSSVIGVSIFVCKT